MFTLNGILKKDEIKEITKKDGSIVKKRIIYIEPKGSIYPIAVSIDNLSLNLVKIGQEISLNIEVYAFYFEDNKLKRANVNYYVPTK